MPDKKGIRPRFRVILIIDAIINLLLGVILMIFPIEAMSLLGLPLTYEPFYSSVLGAILIGIAIALIIECVKEPVALGGLGLGGAIAVNVCGACVLMLWLVSGHLIIPLRGYLILWVIVFVLLIVSGIELILCESGITKKNSVFSRRNGTKKSQNVEAEYEDN